MNWRVIGISALAVAAGFLALSKYAKKEDGPISQEPETPSQFVVGLDAEPERFDPLTMKNPKNFIVSWQIYEGLLALDGAGRIAPSIAERWSTSDNVTWRFHLRQGIAFHSSELFGSPAKSRPVTANDVVASYTAFCSAAAYPAFLLTDSIKGCADYNAGKTQSVEGVHAVDDSTVEITLVQPEPFFLNRLTTAWIAIFPHEALESKHKDTWGLSFAVGTGPFRLVSRNDNEIVLSRNQDYWRQAPNSAVEKLVFRIIKNDQVRLAELNKGGIDLMIVPPTLYSAVLQPTGEPKAEYAEKFRSKIYSTFNSHMIGLNANLVPDVHLRRAMYFGVDRTQVVQSLLYNHADVLGGIVPPGMNGYVPPFDATELYDPTLAREELAKSDYKGEPLELLVHEQAASEQIGQLFQNQMKAIGVNIQLTKSDFNSAIGRVVKGDVPLFSMYLDHVFSSPEPVLINNFSSAKKPVPNVWQFSNPAIDAELNGLRQISGAEAVKKSAEIEQRVLEQVPAIFLFRLNAEVLYSEKVDELAINPHGHFEFAALKLLPSKQ